MEMGVAPKTGIYDRSAISTSSLGSRTMFDRDGTDCCEGSWLTLFAELQGL
jgi:hypothetical protein